MTVEARKGQDKWPHLRYAAPNLGGAEGKAGGPQLPFRVAGRRGRPCRLACVLVLCLFGVSFLAASILLWFTSFFEDTVHRGLVFQEDGPMFAGWKNPPMRPLVRVYVYNYTNTVRFLEGVDKKLRVDEMGPYSYWETLERVNVRFNSNGTMSYNERRTHVFEPALSAGSEDDLVMVPNLPLFGAVSKVRDEGYFAQLSLGTALFVAKATPFNTLRARDFLFGYNNSLYSIAKVVTALSGGGTLPKLGILATRSGLNNDTYTVWTGDKEYSRLDTVSRHRGRSELSAWAVPECNRIDGSEGTFFPLDALKRRDKVYLFNGGICRRLELEFKAEVTVMDGVPALRYGPPEGFFHNAKDNPRNQCYRDFDPPDLPSGVFNNSACSYGSPTFLSFPHFYLGDPKLRQVVDGISPPDPDKHQLYFNIHPVLGMNLGAVSRMQINIMVRQANLISHLSAFNDGDIIPVVWVETKANQFPAETQRAVYHATFTLRAVERGLMYGFPLLAATVGLILACLMLPCRQDPDQKPKAKNLDTRMDNLTLRGD